MIVAATRSNVSIGQLEVVNTPLILAGIALGSCIGLMIYDELRGIAGLAHVMLPSSLHGRIDRLPAKFADQAVPALLERIEKLGGRISACRAKIAGGAQMFIGGDGIRRHVGSRNVEVAKLTLSEYGVPIVAEDTGGKHARTIEFNTENFAVVIKSIGHGQRQI